jgi:hypothetical protein
MFYPIVKPKQKPVERTPTYKIVVVLDESGSMSSIKKARPESNVSEHFNNQLWKIDFN